VGVAAPEVTDVVPEPVVPLAPPGTEGAVSLEGTIAGILAAGFVALIAAFLFLIPMTHVALVVTGALAGNLYEGMLGARRILTRRCKQGNL